MQPYLQTNDTAAVVLILGKQSPNLSFETLYSITKTCLQVSTCIAHHVMTVDTPNNLSVSVQADAYQRMQMSTTNAQTIVGCKFQACAHPAAD